MHSINPQIFRWLRAPPLWHHRRRKLARFPALHHPRRQTVPPSRARSGMAELKLRKSTTALIAMDVQNLQVGALKQNNPERAGMPETLSTVIDAARKAEILVVHVVVRFREGY